MDMPCNHKKCNDFSEWIGKAQCVLKTPCCELCKKEEAVGTAAVTVAYGDMDIPYIKWICQTCLVRAEGTMFVELRHTGLGYMQREVS